MKVYIVMGSTGEYSDRSEWPVKGYKDEQEAQAAVTRMTEAAKVVEAQTKRYSRPSKELTDSLEDRSFRMDYTGTSYFYFEVEVDGL